MRKFAYCGKGFHPERSCMKTKIYILNQLLEKKNISLPEVTKKEGASNFQYKESFFALVEAL